MAENMHHWVSDDSDSGDSDSPGMMHNWVSQSLIPADEKPSKNTDYPGKSNSSGINQRIQTLFRQQLYTDIMFLIDCDKQPQQTLKAHKAILAIGSDFFRKKFFEGKYTDGPILINMKNISHNTLKNVIEFLYTDEILFEDDKTVCELLHAASNFVIQTLVDECNSYVDSIELNETNVFSNIQLAVDNNLTSLKEKCSHFIQENTADVIKSKYFQSANASTVLFICELEKLNLHSEKELLDGILRWAEAQSDSKNKLRSLVEPFLKHVRLMTLTLAELNELVHSYPSVFTAVEVSSISLALGNRKKMHDLPSFCKNNANRCNRQFSGKRTFQANKRIFVPLKHSQEAQILSNLICVLELKCLRGRHKITYLKLSFDGSATELREMINIIISISAKPNKYHFEEYIKINNTKDVIVSFSRNLSVWQGQTVTFKAEVKDVRNLKFLQFDESKSVLNRSPFVCSLACEPKRNKLFFIREVIYHSIYKERRKPSGKN